MNKITRKKYVRYYLPGAFISESEEEEVPWNAKPEDITVPADCFAFDFHTRKSVIVGEDEFKQPMKKVKPGRYYPDGVLCSIEDVKRMVDDNRILCSNIEHNSPTKMGIKARMGNWQWQGKGDVILTDFKKGPAKYYENSKW